MEIPFSDAVPFDASDWRAWTEEPRRYGFHGTLKAPFRLAAGVSEDELIATVAAFARSRAPFEVPSLEVAALEPFIALVPAQDAPLLDDLAAASVEALDAFRAPLDAADRARRLNAKLTERQTRYLDQWGYPYVFEEFRFHMTLTGPLPTDVREAVRAALARRYARIARPVTVAALAVFRQEDRSGRFRILHRLPFGGDAHA